MKYARWTGTAWTISTIDSTGTSGYCGSLVVDFQNKPHISYCSNDSLKYATWTGSSWDIQTVDSLTSGSSYFACCSLALDSKGNPHISYNSLQYQGYGYTHATLKYAYWAGTSWNVNNTGLSGSNGDIFWTRRFSTSMVLDSNDIPHILFSADQVAYLSWNGSGWTSQIINGTVNCDSIVLDSKDTPHISSYSGYNPQYIFGTQQESIDYSTWNGAGWQTEKVAPSSRSDEFATSIALNSEGNPCISYTNPALMYANSTLTYATIPNEYNITFSQTGIRPNFVGIALTVDNVDYKGTDLPKTFTWARGSSHTYNYPTIINVDTTNRYVCNSTSGILNSQSGTMLIMQSGSIMASYQEQYRVSFSPVPPTSGSVSPSGDLWVNPGQLYINASSYPNHSFVQWSSNTNLITITNKVSPSTTATINGPGSIAVYFDVPPTPSPTPTTTPTPNPTPAPTSTPANTPSPTPSQSAAPTPSTFQFNVSVEDKTYPIIANSNSTVSEVNFNPAAKELNFKVSGQTGTTGFCTITIPTSLIWGELSVYKDGSLLVKNVDYTQSTDGANNILQINYSHSIHNFKMVGTEAIPEFPQTIILLAVAAIFLIVTVGLVAYRRRNSHNLAILK